MVASVRELDHRTAGDGPTGGLADAHAHVFPSGLEEILPKPLAAAVPRLTTGPDGGRILRGDAVFRTVRPALWNVTARLAELDAVGIDRQLVSPVPVMLDVPASTGGVTWARAVNSGVAAHVAAAGGRLAGLGMLPWDDVDAAVAECDRLAAVGLAGVEVGTRVQGADLDDERFAPVLDAVADRGLVLFVHPLEGGAGSIRRAGQPFDFGLGMLTDTAIAATALVMGGVLERRPRLRVLLAHGCGTFTWAAPRLRLIGPASALPVDPATFDTLVRRLWVDTLVFDADHVALLARRFGADHVMVGTDHPFIPAAVDAVAALVDDAAELAGWDTGTRAGVRRGNFEAFLRADR